MTMWTGCRVLVTGAAGFVGSNLIRELVDRGADLAGVDLVRASPSLRALGVEGVPIHLKDVRDAERFRWFLSHGDGADWALPEVVFHLAGLGHIRDCQENPLAAWEANVQGTWSVLEACRNLPAGQIKAVVVASSNHVYGSRRAAWREDDPCGQTDVYGTSKGMVDLLVRAYGAMDIPVASLRHVNCFGPADPYRSHLVTGTICDLLEGKPPVIRGDGTSVKGYLHVEDVCRAYLTVAERLVPGTAYNAGGDPLSVLALVDLLIQMSGRDAVPEIQGADLSQQGYVEILEDSLLRRWWQPRPVLQALHETWKWYDEYGGMAWLSA